MGNPIDKLIADLKETSEKSKAPKVVNIDLTGDINEDISLLLEAGLPLELVAQILERTNDYSEEATQSEEEYDEAPTPVSLDEQMRQAHQEPDPEDAAFEELHEFLNAVKDSLDSKNWNDEDLPLSAAEILGKAAGHLQDRAVTYDNAEGERSMEATVCAFENVTGIDMTTEQGWLFMALLKAVRTQQGDFKLDNYEDGAAYFALAGEQAARDR